MQAQDIKMDEKERAETLLTLGYGIVIYAIIVALFVEASNLLPKCRIYHETYGICEEYVEKTPGRSVIQGWIPPGR
jgi:hypothetical protein